MRAALMTAALITSALAEEVKTKRYECASANQDLKVTVEAPDEGTAQGLVRDLWDKGRRAAERAGKTPAPGGRIPPLVICKELD